jgi:hypothetical protein
MRIRSFNALVLLAILFMASLLMVVLPVQGGYSVPVQNCPNVKPKIEIIDESGWRLYGESKDALKDYSFRRYVALVSRYISAKVCTIASNQKGINSPSEVQLFFIYRPLVASAQWQNKEPLNLELSQSNGSRLLDSPWVKITISPLPKPVVRAVFIVSKRQVLVDQALISGAKFTPSQPLIPIDEHMFKQYLKDYNTSVIRHLQSVSQWFAALADISKRLPTEILWFFCSADPGPIAQHASIPFMANVGGALSNRIAAYAASQYIEPTKALIDQFFTSTSVEIRYESILDLKDVFNFEPYRKKPYQGDIS